MTNDTIPTQMNVQLLGNGTVILMSVHVSSEMNTNFVIGADKLVVMLEELIKKASDYPDSPLSRITVRPLETLVYGGDKYHGGETP